MGGDVQRKGSYLYAQVLLAAHIFKPWLPVYYV